ncbi:hypothetical protein [Shewanella benthica]|uniref:STAS/SEC14 domain-containing protein n=1 Tax=Shewanella benthica KT99 TaxID=314608 RepID=A9D541_9GAMM|nr:hypothetical protein [Shewanella benthica]EDQ01349.1 hypothetical protein KT99_01891 [Shewanella benthica KT99]
MSYKIKLIEELWQVHVIYHGIVTLEQRIQAVEDIVLDYADKLAPLKILVNVCDLQMILTLGEQRSFGEFLANHPRLSNAKVAVVHEPDYNPNLFIDTCAFNNGYRLAEFNRIKAAELWLSEP